MEFTPEQVWGAAAAAQRINGEYLKEDQWNRNEPAAFISRYANKNLVKTWLREQDFSQLTTEDYAQGEAIRNHFKGYMLKAMRERLNDFSRSAMKLASKESFTGRDLLDFAIISCLPSVALRDQAKSDLKRDIIASEQLAGEVGDTIVGDIEVVECRWMVNFNKYRITARMGESIVDFWYGKELAGSVRIKGKIKAQRGDKTTQLNYVKRA